MVGEKKWCKNCWTWVNNDLDTCPKCGHPFPVEVPEPARDVESTVQDIARNGFRQAIGRPFKFILIFLLSFIAVLVFIIAEGGKLNGSLDGKYLLGDVVWVSLIALLLTAVLMFIDHMTSD